MGQLATLMYKNLLLLKKSTRETVLILACCIVLPFLTTFTVTTNAYKKQNSTDAQLIYPIWPNPNLTGFGPGNSMSMIPIPRIKGLLPDNRDLLQKINSLLPNNTASLIYLYVAPDTNDVREIMTSAASAVNSTAGLSAVPVFFSDPVEMATKLRDRYRTVKIPINQLRRRDSKTVKDPAAPLYIGVEFSSTSGPEYVYYLRPNGDDIPYTDRLFVQGEIAECVGVTKCPMGYEVTSRLVHVQYAIDRAIVTRANGIMPFVEFWRYPIPPTVFMASLFPVMNLVMPITFALIPLFRYISGKLVEEKECTMKQLLVVMGMKMHTFFLSWFIVFVSFLLLVSVVMTLIIYLGKVITTSIVAFFLLTAAHSLCIFSLGFVISTIFTKTRSAHVFSTFASLIMSMLYFLIPFTRQEGYPFQYGIPVGVVYILMIFPTFTYAIGVDQIFFAEIFRDGVQGEAMFTLGPIPTIWMLVALLASFVFYTALGFVLERLLSPEYGDPPSWFTSVKSRFVSVPSLDTKTYPKEDFEQPDSSWKPMIRIRDVWKLFKQQNKVIAAVRGITLDIFDGQITCILGHNGAGKSTLVSMMTRLLRPTSGQITFSDDSLRQRGSIGVCLQTSSHYKLLTVREHLYILSRLKEVSRPAVAIESVLKEVGLQDSADKACENLSGGQQRRLNVAIALIGDPKVIFLDEPTSGVDPLSRRAIWQILESRKANHCIILTTHYMDEADILADRKAIVSHGTLRCIGSSLFLKHRFGAGYHLNVKMRSDLSESKLNGAKKDMMQFIRSHVPGAAVREDIQVLMSITLPFKDLQAFPQLFGQLEAAPPIPVADYSTVAQSLGIRTYGVELTTLEEVFLRLADEVSGDNVEENEQSFTNPHYGDGSNSVPISTANDAIRDLKVLLAEGQRPSSLRIWISLLLLRLHMLRNAWLTTFGVLIFSPALVFVLVCMFSVVVEQFVCVGCNTKRLEFSPSLYANSTLSQPNSNLPPFIFDNQSDKRISFSMFAKAMPELDARSARISNSTFDYNLGLTALLSSRVWYRDTALHSPPIALNVLSNFALRTANPGHSIRTINAPIGVNKPALAANDSAADSLSRTLPIRLDQFVDLLPMGLTIIYVTAAVRLHTEFTCGSFNQLRCTGVSGLTYWSVQLVVDSLLYLTTTLLTMAAAVVAMLMFRADVQYNSDVLVCDAILVLLYMPVSLLCLYIIVMLLRNAGGPLLGFCITVLYFVLPGAAQGILQLQLISNDPKGAFPGPYYGFLTVPIFLLYNGLVALKYPMAVNPFGTMQLADYFKPENQLIWTYVAGVLHFVGQAVALLLLHKYIAERHTPMFGQASKEVRSSDREASVNSFRDSDVVAEEAAMNSLLELVETNSYEKAVPALVCHNVKLTYSTHECTRCRLANKTKTAVNGLTVSAPNSQVFGLLGPNGAGKTSLLKIISGAERADEGTVYVGGVPIATLSLPDLFDQVSICTQDDSLWMMLTIRDHLYYYASLRGYSGDTRARLVESLIELLQIGQHANKRCEQLSGGTKRKVVFAIAMIKTSRIRLILCDEPTSGLDPQSKRILWDLLIGLFRNEPRCACVFTSHAMEEVEAVCSRIGILINGQLHCLGTIQHCKDKFGNLYTIELKLKRAEGMEKLWPFLQGKFPNAQQVESFVNTNVRINVPRSDVSSLGVAFQILEEARCNAAFELEEYSFGQCTLEQVFLDLVKRHGAYTLD